MNLIYSLTQPRLIETDILLCFAKGGIITDASLTDFGNLILLSFRVFSSCVAGFSVAMPNETLNLPYLSLAVALTQRSSNACNE